MHKNCLFVMQVLQTYVKFEFYVDSCQQTLNASLPFTKIHCFLFELMKMKGNNTWYSKDKRMIKNEKDADAFFTVLMLF